MSKLANQYTNVSTSFLTASVEALQVELDALLNTDVGVGVEAFDIKSFVGKVWETIKRLIAAVKAEIKAIWNKITLAKNKPNPRYQGMVSKSVISASFKKLREFSLEAHGFVSTVSRALESDTSTPDLFEKLDRFNDEIRKGVKDIEDKIKADISKASNSGERNAAYVDFATELRDADSVFKQLNDFEKLYVDAERLNAHGNIVNKRACTILGLAFRSMAIDLRGITIAINNGFNSFPVTDVSK